MSDPQTSLLDEIALGEWITYDCPSCGGSGEGHIEGSTCATCRGKGEVTTRWSGPGFGTFEQR